LTGGQRRRLRALAHHLSPVVQVGKEGVTDSLLGAVEQALEDHELIKVRVLESAPVARKEAGQEIADWLGAHVAGGVGRVLILYRRHPNKPSIRLPPASR
jgi:RNA-binding protein